MEADWSEPLFYLTHQNQLRQDYFTSPEPVWLLRSHFESGCWFSC